MQPDARSPDAAELFRDYLRRRDAGEAVDFDALCRAHPALAAELQRREAMRRLLDSALPGSLDGDLPRRRGDLPADSVGPVAGLLARLRQRPPAEQRYTVLDEIGRGGMGTVLRVLDNDLRRRLAMKVAHGEPAETEPSRSSAVHRFLEEAQITSQLDHPGVVPLHDVGLGADGKLFFTMRLVRGETLGAVFDRVARGDAEWTQVRAVGVLLRVCEAMSYAHSERVVHRDLKPANVMVGRFGEVYVMDWGVAGVVSRTEGRSELPAPADADGVDTARHPRGEDAPEAPALTRYGRALGTPAYMSPEQAEGRSDEIGPPTDVYAVGAMLYHLIAGHMPYGTEGATTPQALHELVRRGPPTPLSRLGRRTPPALLAICDKAMARAIADRYPTMHALARDLRAFIEGRVVAAHATGAWAETRQWVRRNRALAAALAAAVLLLVAGLVTFFVLERRASRRADVLAVLASLDELQRQEADWEFAPPAGTTTWDWWRRRARELIDGLQNPLRIGRQCAGLVEFDADLTALRSQPAEPDTKVASLPFPRQAELDRKRRRLAWYAAMLRLPGASFQQIDETALRAETRDLWWFRLNQIAWHRVDPRHPVFGSEGEGLFYAERAIERFPGWCLREVWDKAVFRCWDLQWWRRYRSRFVCLVEELAWALYANGRMDEAQVTMHAAQTLGSNNPDHPWLEVQLERWRDGSANLVYETFEKEVDALDEVKGVWDSFRPEDAALHGQLSEVVERLEKLAGRLRNNEQVCAAAHQPFSWPDAIAAIERHPRYGGLRITPQVDLVPLGPDPATTLWEFGHLRSGEPAQRDHDGNLVLGATTGMVFVLLPKATVRIRDGQPRERRVPVDLDEFFLSKFEMTQLQWLRMSADSPDVSPWTELTGPVSNLSADIAAQALARTGGWLRLPTCAQWERACWGDKQDAESPGDWNDTTIAGRRPKVGNLTDVRAQPANSLGFHGMLGNAVELCCDDPTPAVTPRPGDGLRQVGGHTTSVVGEMGSGRGDSWTGAVQALERRFSTGLRPARRLMR